MPGTPFFSSLLLRMVPADGMMMGYLDVSQFLRFSSVAVWSDLVVLRLSCIVFLVLSP